MTCYLYLFTAPYFRGEDPKDAIPAIYSSVPVERLTDLYHQVVRHAELHGGQQSSGNRTDKLPTLYSDGEKAVGSRYVVRMAELARAISEATECLASLRQKNASVIAIHNVYTALVMAFVMALTGTRGTRSSLAMRFDIDVRTSSAFVSEKDNGRYVNTRVIWVPPLVVALLAEYARHESRIRQYLALKNPAALRLLDARDEIRLLSPHNRPDRVADMEEIDAGATRIYFLSEQTAVPEPVLLHIARERLGRNWPLHLGALRHFVRTNLLLRCVSGEYINAHLGHHDRGQAPWDRYSTLPPRAVRKTLELHLNSIAKDLGLSVIRSPLLS